MTPWERRRAAQGTPQPIIPVRPPVRPALEVPRAEADLDNTQTKTGSERLNQRKTIAELDEKRRAARQYPVSKEDASIIDRLRTDADGATKSAPIIREAAGAIDRLKTGPGRAKVLQYSIPGKDDGILSSLGKGIIGAFVDDRDQADYQTLQGLSSGRVLDTQLDQKGIQTASDATRMELSEVGVDKPTKTNAQIIGRTQLQNSLKQMRPDFYGDWARKYGSLSAANEKGFGVDKAWNALVGDAQRRYYSDPRVTKLTQPRRPEKRVSTPKGWKIERLD